MTRFSDWSGYVKKTTGTPPRALYQRAVALFDRPGTAVDLGCGAGNETLDLLQRGQYGSCSVVGGWSASTRSTRTARR